MSGSRTLRLVASILLGVGTISVIFTLWVDRGAEGRLIEGNFPVNESARTEGDISANNSPSVVMDPTDPTNVIVVNRVDRPDFDCGIHISSDGASTFADVELPLPEEVEEPKCFAPDAAYDSEGRLYVFFVTLTGLANVPEAGWIVSSDDGGATFTEPVEVLGPLSFQARLVADPSDPGTLHLTWLQAEDVAILAFPNSAYPILSASSSDGGETWSEPAQVNDPDHVRAIAPVPVVARSGELMVSYLDLGEDSLDYNGGHQGAGGPPYPGTWSLHLARAGKDGFAVTEVEGQITPTERFVVFLPPSPSVAVSPEGEDVYVAFHDDRFGDTDVYVWHSSDGGRNFEDAIRVPDLPEGDGTTQRLPKISVAPNGRVDVIYYDRRRDDDDVLTDVSYQFSTDGAKSFRPHVKLNSETFSSRVGVGVETDLPDLGTRHGLLSTDERALAVWTDTRTGDEASVKQDIVRAVVEVSDAAALSDPLVYLLRYGGLSLALVGLLLLAAAGTPTDSERSGEV